MLRYQQCPNCGDPSPREYCPACGQRNFDLHVSFRKIAGEFVGELASLDSRIARTIVPFLVRPGELTRAYLAGQRKRFSSPIRLFLVTSFLLFVLAPLRNTARVENQQQLTEQQRTELAQARDRLRQGGLFSRMMARQLERLATEDPRAFNARLQRSFFDAMTKVAFFLLPAFALLLKLFYVRSRRFYAEHVIFSIHLHSFGFFVTAIAALSGIGIVELAAVLGIVVYAVAALRRVYGQGWGLTIAKAFGLGLSYLVLLIGGVTAAAIVAFVTM